MPQLRLERFALVCAAVAVAACSGKDRTSAADSAAMAPAGGAMSSDTGAMSGAAGGAMGGTPAATGSTTDSANRAGAMGGTSGSASSSGTAGTSGAAGTGGAVPNQTQSGVTNATTGKSTLGPNIKKVGPTTAADSASQRKP